MPWAAIITILIETFGPLLVEWLKKWLEKKLSDAALTLPNPADFTPSELVTAPFDVALTQLPRLAFARRTFLRTLRGIAEAHAADLVQASVRLTADELTADEVAAVRDAAHAADNE